ncbi:hypothetical protein K505DRAFT_326545 [Melanomma pulvis-pyrius CBS 109.77]|uniref:Protein NO VEIN C-terminal domain-containing protein n=1 Tax=Melanomma pulvis-pyrius CBS 109.77 TaxID=1314802 RepID=A0A6A6X7J3_9PLEO|nr:hypothetical protein K505DRAFT_326545 [Melanomma pulvis-pyrius CBS 109.77]
MATTVTLDRNEARKLVETIARGHGHIPAEMLASMPPDIRLVVEEALRKKDDMIASSVFTLARNLYASTARFIFELLQNADDNQYTEAQSAGDDPCVSFSVYHDMLVMDCNEDGFTEENLRAICDIGKSSKHGAQGYIGEKGIGFKSTFMAAWKVQIQSGPLSFYFQHREGDSGMGMVTPIWVEPQTQFSGPLTRTTLYFHDNGEPGNLQSRRDDIIKQLWDLQGTVLLFLQKLRTIKITVFDEGGQCTWSRQTTMVKGALDSTVELHTIESKGSASRKIRHRFYVTSHLAQNLAKNQNRTYTEAEEKTQAYSTAKVVVAFPFDDNNQPVIEPQEIFAFMPVRKVGFNFLIHSDFVTQANRQDIVTTSERNIGLRLAIGVAFAKGVQELCNHPGLRYGWLRFLPSRKSPLLDPFWNGLVPYIRSSLSMVPVVFSRNEISQSRYKISELRRLNSTQLDKNGNPLVPDLPTAKYLSAAYNVEDLDILDEYGLLYLQVEDMMPMLQAFVKQPSWKLKVYHDRDEDWNSRMAKLIMQVLDDKDQHWMEKVRVMPLLPLCSGTFQSPLSTDPVVFFPDINGTPIPEDLDLAMILSAAAANPDCRKLYETLGVKTASLEKVRTLIINKHRSWKQRGLNVTMASSHLRYLYQTDQVSPVSAKERDDVVVVFDQKERAKYPVKEYVYLPGEGDLSPGNLLRPTETTEPEEPDVSFIHPAYLQDPPTTPTGYEQSWNEWLYKCMYLEEKVQIFTDRARGPVQVRVFTREWLFLAKHRSDKVVARLQSHWKVPEIRKLWETEKSGTLLVREVEVTCASGARHQLQNTFVPFPSLLARCGTFLTDVNAIPFLKLSSPLEDSEAHEWVGLGKHFGIGATDDLDFSLAILQAISYGESKTKRSLTQTVLDLYLRIYAQCLASEDKEDAQKKVRENFVENHSVFCSPSLPNESEGDKPEDVNWASPTKCLWDAPGSFTTREPVRYIWEPVMKTLSPQDRGNLEQFFRHTLQIGEVTHGDILEELGDFSELCESDLTYSPGLEDIHEIYQMLDGLRKGMDEIGSLGLKECFEEEDLIYVPAVQPQSKRWFKVSECVWSNEGAMLGKPCLEPFYPQLTELFVDFFGVPKLNFALVYRQLLEIGSSIPTIDYVKNLLWSLKTLLAADIGTRPAFADEVTSCRVFPVRMPDGSTQPLTALDDFAIIDRQHYADALKNKIKVLDFSLDEVRLLKHLIGWTGLTDRYLSRSVVERTVVEDEKCVVDRHLTRDLIRKSGAFVSIAAHFDSPLASPKPEIMHSNLRKTRVFFTETIMATLVIQQDDKEIISPVNNSSLHIQAANGGGFEIYVLADEDARDFCVASRLPREFAACLLDCKPSSVDPQVVSVVASIIHAKPTSTSRVLEANGIIELDLPPYNDDDDVGDDPVSNPEAIVRLTPGRLSTLTPAVGFGQYVNGGRSPFPDINESTPSPSLFQQNQNEDYRKLLVQVVKAARSMRLPNQNPIFDMSGILQTVQGDPTGQNSYRFLIGDKTVWRRMVGAAGELFVFELLSGIRPALPGFNRSSWRSTVRRYAKVHPEYTTLEHWEGAETSDIFYSDGTGALTTVLIDRGYLDETWRDEKPNYYIEVKTTMSNNFETPFHLSRYQYLWMQNKPGSGEHLPQQKKKLYVLFRVYGLESGDVGVRVYIDPEAARKDGRLEFEADGWIVTPRKKARSRPQAQDGGEAEATGIGRNFGIDLQFGCPVMPVFGSPSSA